MQDNFKSLIELNDYFKEEKTCYEFLALQIWDEGKPVCPHCNSTHVYTTKSRSVKGNKAGSPVIQISSAILEAVSKYAGCWGCDFVPKVSLMYIFSL